MKTRKILALVLAVALTLALAAPAMAAGDYPDVPAGHWAVSYIRDMTDKGLFEGYDDGNFHPDDPITQATGLTLCARVMVDSDTRTQILADRSAQIRELVPDNYDWFRKNAATCLELNVIDPQELGRMSQEEQLGLTMTKSDFAVYLVRAMGLEDMANSLPAGPLDFADDGKIDDFHRPYVKLLTNYGVLTGDENKNFNPDSNMSRAVCATMLSRALTVVDTQKIQVEIPRYTKYNWTVGYIKSVSPSVDGYRTMVLESDITGEHTVYIPDSASIYQYNRLVSFSALKAGAFAKVCYATDGRTVAAVRVTPAELFEEDAGACDALSPTSVTVDGATYTIDRFTEVAAGGKAGDAGVIDYAAQYTDASVVYNGAGTVISLKLSGGTRQLEGILTDVTTLEAGLTTKTTMTVTGFNGVQTTYQVGSQVSVRVNGQDTTDGLKDSFEGKHVVIRVADDDLAKLDSVNVDLLGSYIQGILRSVDAKSEPQRVEITRTGDYKKTPYNLDKDCVVTYSGKESKLSALTTGVFVTAQVEGGDLVDLSAWQGYTDTTGILSITHGDPTRLVVTRENGTTAEFSIPLSRLADVAITSGGKDSDITKLKSGDTVTVTQLYNDVTQIDFISQAANVTGTVTAVISRANEPTQLEVKLSSGEVVTYTATAATTVTRGGTPVNLSEVQTGSQVSLVAEGVSAISIELTGTAQRRDSVKGSIYQKDDKGRELTLLVTENGQTRTVKVTIPTETPILDVNTGASLRLGSLKLNDRVQVWGGYATDGTFTATSAIRE